MKYARGIATPILPLARAGGSGGDAVSLLGNEWNGFTLDFIGDTYAVRTSIGAETLLGTGPYNSETGVGLDFTDNSYAIGA